MNSITSRIVPMKTTQMGTRSRFIETPHAALFGAKVKSCRGGSIGRDAH
jgi:hypothetical protein